MPSSMADAIREQSRLIAAQNTLLQQMSQTGATNTEMSAPGRMMNEYDLQLILMSDNIIEAIDRWNAGRKPRRRQTQ